MGFVENNPANKPLMSGAITASPGPIAVALSGGPDSMALCWLLSQQATAPLHVITVDHGLRPEAAAEAVQVGAWVAGWPQVRHVILKLDALSANSRVMEKARDCRYEIMAAYCREHKLAQLYTAHHLDDQAETFLFRLAKGSGPDGLGAMRPEQRYDDHLALIRPLLGIAKESLVATCHAHDIPFVQDPTNINPAFARSRLRQAAEVLAREGLTPKRLGVTAARLRRACDALDHYARAAWDKLLNQEGTDHLTFDYVGWCAEPPEIRLRILLRALTENSDKNYGPRREKVEELAELLIADPAFTARTLGGYIIARDRKNGILSVKKEAPL